MTAPPAGAETAAKALISEGLALHRAGKAEEAAERYRRALALQGSNPDALTLLGAFHAERGRFKDAVRLLAQSLRVNPRQVFALNLLGSAFHSLQSYTDAIDAYDRAIALKPGDAAAYNNRGNALSAAQRHEDALASFDEALLRQPGNAQFHRNRADALRSAGRYEEALAGYARALALGGASADLHCAMGVALQSLKRDSEAVGHYDKAIELDPRSATAFNNRGNALSALKEHATALASYDEALRLNPSYAEAYNNRGLALRQLGCYEEALAEFAAALHCKPDYAVAHYNRGLALRDQRRYSEALRSFDSALSLHPYYAEAQKNRGDVLRDLRRLEEALACYDKVLALQPEWARLHSDRAYVLRELKRPDEALASIERALALDPDMPYAAGQRLTIKMHMCDWRGLDEARRQVIDGIASGKSSANPFAFLNAPATPEMQLRCAQLYAAKLPQAQSPEHAPAPRTAAAGRLRVGYLSADFHGHATAHLMAGVFETHDRSRFEVHAISFGPDDKGDMRARLRNAFEHFIDAAEMDDAAVAALLRQRAIDIAVDLKGYTRQSRPQILALRGAPIQVNYLGFPGTMGAAFMDYIIADRRIIPEAEQQFYSEKVAYLPDSYQCNDAKRPLGTLVDTRADFSLPPDAFVFCCFNNVYKITPETFEIWMRILTRTDGSVLWLMNSNGNAVANLRREAQHRGVAPERLIFSPQLPNARHLARHALADLFLDTLPINAHTTAADALWAGLPVLTCAGNTFAGRVAASLLAAVGLPELVTTNLADYEARALRLATNRAELAALKAKLSANRRTHPLFDTARITRHLEAAYLHMAERYRRGQTPESFAVDPSDKV